MMKTLSLLLRGAVADNAQALHDANAVAILRQQIRDAAAALAGGRRELAIAMAYRAAEDRALEAIASRIVSLSDGARNALADGHEDLGREAAVLIAVLEDERAERQRAVARFAGDIDRLTGLVTQGARRLRDLDHGLQTVRASEAVRRAGLNGRRVVALSAGALGDAEQTLAGLRDRQRHEDDLVQALATLEEDAVGAPETRLRDAGYVRPRTDPQAILDRLRGPA